MNSIASNSLRATKKVAGEQRRVFGVDKKANCFGGGVFENRLSGKPFEYLILVADNRFNNRPVAPSHASAQNGTDGELSESVWQPLENAKLASSLHDSAYDIEDLWFLCPIEIIANPTTRSASQTPSHKVVVDTFADGAEDV